jgi:hypothetical protein
MGPKHDPRILRGRAQHRGETGFRRQEADPTLGQRRIPLELPDDLAESVLGTDRLPRHDSNPGVVHISDDRVTPGGKPETESRIDDLVRTRMPTEGQNQLSGPSPLGNGRMAAHPVV